MCKCDPQVRTAFCEKCWPWPTIPFSPLVANFDPRPEDKNPAAESQLCPGEDQRECGPSQTPRALIEREMNRPGAPVIRHSYCSHEIESAERVIARLQRHLAMWMESARIENEAKIRAAAERDAACEDLVTLRSAGVTAGALVVLQDKYDAANTLLQRVIFNYGEPMPTRPPDTHLIDDIRKHVGDIKRECAECKHLRACGGYYTDGRDCHMGGGIGWERKEP